MNDFEKLPIRAKKSYSNKSNAKRAATKDLSKALGRSAIECQDFYMVTKVDGKFTYERIRTSEEINGVKAKRTASLKDPEAPKVKRPTAKEILIRMLSAGTNREQVVDTILAVYPERNIVSTRSTVQTMVSDLRAAGMNIEVCKKDDDYFYKLRKK